MSELCVCDEAAGIRCGMHSEGEYGPGGLHVDGPPADGEVGPEPAGLAPESATKRPRSSAGDVTHDASRCGFCGKSPAAGFALINHQRYCHGDDDPEPTCYMRATWGDKPPADTHSQDVMWEYDVLSIAHIIRESMRYAGSSDKTARTVMQKLQDRGWKRPVGSASAADQESTS